MQLALMREKSDIFIKNKEAAELKIGGEVLCYVY
jgi:ribosomal protein S8